MTILWLECTVKLRNSRKLRWKKKEKASQLLLQMCTCGSREPIAEEDDNAIRNNNSLSKLGTLMPFVTLHLGQNNHEPWDATQNQDVRRILQEGYMWLARMYQLWFILACLLLLTRLSVNCWLYTMCFPALLASILLRITNARTSRFFGWLVF